jgi:hypothetical protein
VPLRVPDAFWVREDVDHALGAVTSAFCSALVAKYAGASQTQIAIAVGMTQGQVSTIGVPIARDLRSVGAEAGDAEVNAACCRPQPRAADIFPRCGHATPDAAIDANEVQLRLQGRRPRGGPAAELACLAAWWARGAAGDVRVGRRGPLGNGRGEPSGLA